MKMRAALALVSIFILLRGIQLSAADSEVSGVFNGNEQPAKLIFVSARKGTPVGGRDTIQLVFTEKDHSKDEQAALKALFGDYGNALVIGIQPDGKVVTCDILHEAHKQKPISSPASVKMTDFKNEGGQISGRLVTEGKQEAFEQTWEVNLVFKTKRSRGRAKGKVRAALALTAKSFGSGKQTCRRKQREQRSFCLARRLPGRWIQRPGVHTRPGRPRVLVIPQNQVS